MIMGNTGSIHDVHSGPSDPNFGWRLETSLSMWLPLLLLNRFGLQGLSLKAFRSSFHPHPRLSSYTLELETLSANTRGDTVQPLAQGEIEMCWELWFVYILHTETYCGKTSSSHIQYHNNLWSLYHCRQVSPNEESTMGAWCSPMWSTQWCAFT